jgi:hypothetical protein
MHKHNRMKHDKENSEQKPTEQPKPIKISGPAPQPTPPPLTGPSTGKDGALH